MRKPRYKSRFIVVPINNKKFQTSYLQFLSKVILRSEFTDQHLIAFQSIPSTQVNIKMIFLIFF